MRVRVTSGNIQNGVQQDSHHCMLADAIKACYPRAKFIMVDLQTIRFSDERKRVRYKYLTPSVAQKALLKFDKGERNIQPFEFELQAPIVRKMDNRKNRRANTPKLTAAQKRARVKKYAYLAANRAKLSREREFGLRQFVD